MSVEAPTQTDIAEQAVHEDPAFWEHVEDEMARDMHEVYIAEDVGLRMFGRTALTGVFAPNFHTDRIMPRRMTGTHVAKVFFSQDRRIR